MTWVKLDDQFFRNPKAQAVGKDGRELYLAGLCYSAGQLTDGRIPKAVVSILCSEANVRQGVIPSLVQSGLWVDYGDHYGVHDWERYNPPASKVKEEREKGAERQRQSRSRRDTRSDSHRDPAVTDGDPSRPRPDVPSGTSLAKSTLDSYWESVHPKPATRYIGLLKIAEHLLDCGWSAGELDHAFRTARTHTTAALEFVLRSQRAENAPRSVGDRNLRALQGGAS